MGKKGLTKKRNHATLERREGGLLLYLKAYLYLILHLIYHFYLRTYLYL